MAMQPIVFYDIPNAKTNLQEKSWSPHCWKIRFALNYKGLPYTTVWVEYPDIETLSKRIGAAPTDPGAEYGEYTLPAIYDPNTGRVLSDSVPIVRYLDATYPATPPLLPPQLDPLIQGFCFGFGSQITAHVRPIIVPAVAGTLSARGQAYFRRTREREMGPLDEVAPRGSKKLKNAWNGFEAGLGRVTKWFSTGDGRERTWALGETVTYADLMMGGVLMWVRNTFGPESEEWKNMEKWDGGRWGRLVAQLQPYSAVDEGTVGA